MTVSMGVVLLRCLVSVSLYVCVSHVHVRTWHHNQRKGCWFITASCFMVNVWAQPMTDSKNRAPVKWASDATPTVAEARSKLACTQPRTLTPDLCTAYAWLVHACPTMPCTHLVLDTLKVHVTTIVYFLFSLSPCVGHRDNCSSATQSRVWHWKTRRNPSERQRITNHLLRIGGGEEHENVVN